MLQKIREKVKLFHRIFLYKKSIILQLLREKNVEGISLIFAGFEPNKLYYYEFNKYNKEDYLNDYFVNINNYYINNKYKYIIQDKLNFYLFMKNFTNRICPIIGYYGLDKRYYEISNSVDVTSKYILKPNKGTKGKGISILSNLDIDEKLSDYIVSPFLSPKNYSSSIFSKSLNTIRILTAVIESDVIVISAVHRFGIEESGIVDNFSAGGISAFIDIENGTITKACQIKNREKILITHHPDTNKEIVGCIIPGWINMINELKCIHKNIGYIKYLGWDIAMLNNNDFSIIEANHMPDLDLIQCHGPILKDSIIRDFYNNYK